MFYFIKQVYSWKLKCSDVFSPHGGAQGLLSSLSLSSTDPSALSLWCFLFWPIDAIKMQQIQMIISNGSSGRSYSACSAKFLQFPVHNFTSYLHLVPIYCLTLKNFEPWHHLVIYKFSWNVLEGKLSLDGSMLSCTCIHSSRGQQSVFISQNWENGSCRKKHTTLD